MASTSSRVINFGPYPSRARLRAEERHSSLLAHHRLLDPDLPPASAFWTTSIQGISAAWRWRTLVVDSRTYSHNGKFDNIPVHDAFASSVGSADPLYCDNETIDGVQSDDPRVPPLLPLVSNYPLSVMSRRIPPRGPRGHLRRHGVDVNATAVPLTMTYQTLADTSSLYDTPAVLPTGLVLRRACDVGGVRYYSAASCTPRSRRGP
ncbi:hypothetical protein C8R46DRAFT_1299269 [Mycena filopes]|nr:hypothetical protein C8R46DRAFT_1299269 [Mycena filopes]